MTLHIINQSPRHSDALAQCLSVCQPGDSVVLIEGALELLTDAMHCNHFFGVAGSVKCFALLPTPAEEDPTKRINNIIQLIDFKQFVDLTIDHQPIVSW